MILKSGDLPLVRIDNPGARIVLTQGCFDMRHPGHDNLFEEAHSLGDLVVVSILGDRKVRELKGFPRPIQPALHRAAMVNKNEDVWGVTVEHYRPGIDRRAFFRVVNQLQPHVFLGDETWVDFADQIEAEGIEFHQRTPEKVDSTTAIIGRILSSGQVLPQPA